MNEEENKKDKGLTLAEFQPAESQLQELANKAKSVDISNIKEVHAIRIELRDARTALVKKGKELREGALLFQKKVISKEKDLLAIILADEERLEAIENEAKMKEEMEKRRIELPTRLAALNSIGLNILVSDEDLLKMDDNMFNEFRLNRIEQKLQADKLAAEADQREKDRIAREKLEAERAEFEKQKKADDDKRHLEQSEIDKEKARLAGIEEQRQAEIKRAKEAIEAETRLKEIEIAKKKEAEAAAAFQEYLKSIGYDDNTDKIEWASSGAANVYRLIGKYLPKKN